VKLSYNIVRNYLTKGNGQVSDQDIVQFISICKFNQLNPFLNEAYLVKFGNSPAQMIVSKEALMKRADACDKYEGMQGGIIVIRDNQIFEVEGCFHSENEKLVGGWAKVYRSDRKFPIVSKVNLSEYDKKQSLWNEKPSTMISKIAKVQALREAFPAQLGAMYTQEESAKYTDYEDVTERVERTKAEFSNKETINIDNAPKSSDAQPDPAPAPSKDAQKEEPKEPANTTGQEGSLFNEAQQAPPKGPRF
jgi:phage recombination protein Bet